MNPLDRSKFCLLLVLAVVAAGLLFIGGPGYDSLRSLRYLWDIGHLFCFGLWAYLYSELRRNIRFSRVLFEVLLLTFVVGGLTELIQAGIGREASWPDLGNDLLGSLSGLFFFSPAKRELPFFPRKTIQIPLLLILCWSFWPTGKVIVDDLIAWRQFPLLSGFETSLEATRWSGSARRRVDYQVAFSGRAALEVRLSTQRYSGIGLKDFPRNWSAYRRFSMQVYNPENDSFPLYFRIHDHDHNNSYSDRYNTGFQLSPGWNQLQVALDSVARAPKNRQLDLTRIAGMGVFVGKLKRPRIIYLDEVRLLP